MDSQLRRDWAVLKTLRDKECARVIGLYEKGPYRRPLFYTGDENYYSEDLVPDRFGFLCEKSQPQGGAPGTKQKRTESRRLGKWVKMLKNYSKYRGSMKFHQRIFKGIPSEVRGKVWMIMLDVDAQKAQNPGKYMELKEQARLQSKHFHEINSAVERTFRNHLMFRDRYGIKQQDLFGILMAYSMYNPEVGYGQGLSHIAALLLMWLSEENAFWALVQLLENKKYMMSGLYKPGLPKLEMLQNHLEDVVHRTLPALEQHLEKQGVSLKECTVPWFTQCFLDVVPFPLALQFWDIIILEGAHILTTAAYMILKLNRKRLLKMPRGHLQEFLQDSLKQAWAQDNKFIAKQLQASKHELAKLRCLLPPEVPGESCSVGQGLSPDSQEPAPVPPTPQDGEAAQAPGPLCKQPEPSVSLTETPPVEQNTYRLVWGIDEDEANSNKEDSSESLGQGALVRASGCPYVINPDEIPWSMWNKGRPLQYWSLPNLRMPVQGEDCPPAELGSQEAFRARSLPFMEPLGSGPLKMIPASDTGLEMASLNGSLLEYDDIDKLEYL